MLHSCHHSEVLALIILSLLTDHDRAQISVVVVVKFKVLFSCRFFLPHHRRPSLIHLLLLVCGLERRFLSSRHDHFPVGFSALPVLGEGTAEARGRLFELGLGVLPAIDQFFGHIHASFQGVIQVCLALYVLYAPVISVLFLLDAEKLLFLGWLVSAGEDLVVAFCDGTLLEKSCRSDGLEFFFQFLILLTHFLGERRAK